MVEKIIVFLLSLIGLAPSTLNQPIIPVLQISPTPTIIQQIIIPESKLLSSDYHVFQTFNNCGPAALSMALSHYGINISQQVLGQQLRPYQVPSGDNDDKSVTLSELATKGEELGFTAIYRPMGTTDVLKKFIAADMPVITRTWLTENEDIGHYRVIKGFNDATQSFIQDDSLQGKNLIYSYTAFDAIWSKFNNEYLVLVPKEKIDIATRILGSNFDINTAWQEAAEKSTGLNKSVALYHIGDYAGSAAEFEKVENQLPFRALWYQIEPILSYYELGNYDRVFEITNKILNNHNRAFSELYEIRGKIYENQNRHALAEEEFALARKYRLPR